MTMSLSLMKEFIVFLLIFAKVPHSNVIMDFDLRNCKDYYMKCNLVVPNKLEL
jgi:hypothetical protein